MRKTRFLTEAALVASLYAGLTAALMPVAFSALQFRPAEALTVLPFLFPSAVPGLAVGCAVANLWSRFGVLDIVFGALATLIAAVCTRFLRRFRCGVWLAPLPPVVLNALVVGALIAYSSAEPGGQSFWSLYLTEGSLLFISEALVCYLLGLPLLFIMKRFWDGRERSGGASS